MLEITEKGQESNGTKDLMQARRLEAVRVARRTS